MPAGTLIPWSTAVSIDTEASDRGAVHVYLMEGADRVASYRIDLSLPAGLDKRHKRGGVGGGAGMGDGALDARLKFSLRVDLAGVPRVEAARWVFGASRRRFFVEEGGSMRGAL